MLSFLQLVDGAIQRGKGLRLWTLAKAVVKLRSHDDVDGLGGCRGKHEAAQVRRVGSRDLGDLAAFTVAQEPDAGRMSLLAEGLDPGGCIGSVD